MAVDEFFDTPEQQSIIKTKIVAKYFGAWTKIMLNHAPSPSEPIAYFDLFSGPGVFEDGSASTPLWVLSHAINNPALSSRLVTLFNDKNREYVERLRTAIDNLPGIERLAHKPVVLNFEVGSDVVNTLRDLRQTATLFFIDPWGYKGLTLELIGKAIRNWGCDCIFFFNYNRVNPGINNPFVVDRMNDLFGAARADQLRKNVRGRSAEDRRAMIIDELSAGLRDVGGAYILPFEFKSPHGERTSHYIIFVSKNFLGYHIMKEVMFGLSSDQADVRSFEYVPRRAPQLPLFEDRQYSLTALKDHLKRECAGRSLTVWQVYESYTVDTPYTLRNVKDALAALEAEGYVTIDIPADKRPKRKGQVTLADKRIVTFPL